MLYYMGCLYYSGAGSLHTRVSYRNSQPIETKTVTLVLGVVACGGRKAENVTEGVRAPLERASIVM